MKKKLRDKIVIGVAVSVISSLCVGSIIWTVGQIMTISQNEKDVEDLSESIQVLIGVHAGGEE